MDPPRSPCRASLEPDGLLLCSPAAPSRALRPISVTHSLRPQLTKAAPPAHRLAFLNCVVTLGETIGALVFVFIATPWLALAIPCARFLLQTHGARALTRTLLFSALFSRLSVLVPVYYLILRVYLATSKQLIRLEAGSKSPLYTAFSTAVSGLTTVRPLLFIPPPSRLAASFFADLAVISPRSRSAPSAVGSSSTPSPSTSSTSRRDPSSSVSRARTSSRACSPGSRRSSPSASPSSRSPRAPPPVLASSASPSARWSVPSWPLSPLVHVGLTPNLLLARFQTSLGQQLTHLLQAYAQMENGAVSVERIREFTQLPPEEPPFQNIAQRKPLGPDWPSSGEVRFVDLSARYRRVCPALAPAFGPRALTFASSCDAVREDLPFALNGLNIVIRGGQRVGVCGRTGECAFTTGARCQAPFADPLLWTGSGKSSTLLALFRALDQGLISGRIEIDGVDIATIPLESLRSSMRCVLLPLAQRLRGPADTRPSSLAASFRRRRSSGARRSETTSTLRACSRTTRSGPRFGASRCTRPSRRSSVPPALARSYCAARTRRLTLTLPATARQARHDHRRRGDLLARPGPAHLPRAGPPAQAPDRPARRVDGQVRAAALSRPPRARHR